MNKFILRVSITFMALLLLAFALDVVITNNLHHSNANLFHSWNDILYGNVHCNAVIMGNSRGQVQYSPSILDSALGTDFYNISVDGRCIDAEVAKFYTYLEYNPVPELIIQNVDFGNLLMSNGYEREQFLPYLSCDVLFNEISEIENFDFSDKYFPLIRYSGYIEVIKEGLHLPNKLRHDSLFKGYNAHDDQWDGSAFRKVSTASFGTNPEAVRIFDKYLTFCKKNKIQVILVFAPIYIGVTEKMDNNQQMFDYYQHYADKYGFPLLNYTYDSLCYDTAYFYNATHLNKLGSELFTRKLAHDIDSLNLLKN